MWLSAVGWTGAASVLVAYKLGDDRLHVLGAVCMGVYSTFNQMWPQVVSNVMWLAIAVRKLVVAASERRVEPPLEPETVPG